MTGRRVAPSLLIVVLLLPVAQRCRASAGNEVDALSRMSLADLSSVEVTSASKLPESLGEAAASLYVITREQIARSGATSLAQALRLAPNLLVTQRDARTWTLSARGFGDQPELQYFSNKLLMLIDGRSVYNPLFSGIYLDAQDLMLEDIDRIEVISGSGGTLWGANAVNGVINVITRPAAESRSVVIDALAGSQQRGLAARAGFTASSGAALRVYAKGSRHDAQYQSGGTRARDGWSAGQAGFRLDADDAGFTLQGDAYHLSEDSGSELDQRVSGANLLARWQRRSARSNFSAQLYLDQTQRRDPYSIAFVLHTFDLELQESVAAGAHELVFGAGQRLYSYGITNSLPLGFEPPDRRYSLTSVFAQDTIALGRSARAIVGLKLENDPYRGWITLPNLRLTLQTGANTMLWLAASQANRAPTPFDVDVVERLGSVIYLHGNRGFRPERLTAFEAGIRGMAGERISYSASGFHNRYRDLRSIEPASATALVPFTWGNLLRGNTYGVEAWATIQVSDAWRLSPGITAVHESLTFEPGASGLLGPGQAGNDPSVNATLSSSFDLGPRWRVDATARYVGARPSPALPAHVELDARIGWWSGGHLEVALVGENLLHADHLEYPAPVGERIGRAGWVDVTYRY